MQFDTVRVVPTIPVHQEVAGLRLGEGESIRGNRYTFSGTFGHPGSNYHRTLHSASAGFNSDRWTFGGDQITQSGRSSTTEFDWEYIETVISRPGGFLIEMPVRTYHGLPVESFSREDLAPWTELAREKVKIFEDGMAQGETGK